MAVKQTEPSVNLALGNLLRGMMRTCEVRSENTGLIVDQSGAQIDNLITSSGRSPVAVEAEFRPARDAEADAESRLGRAIKGEARKIEAAVALRYPAALRRKANLEQALREAKLSWCVLYDETDEDGARVRFPQSGWLEGGIDDLADLIRLVSTPQREVDRAANSLQAGIDRAAGVLNELREKQQGIVRSVADLLGMDNVEQTRRMACAIIANALVFHGRIAGMHDGVKPLHLVCGPDVDNPQRETLAAWASILEINYFPIFAIARDILEQLPPRETALILSELHSTAQEIDSAGIDNAHDLTGRVFQRLIADRKYLATFYTRPSSAALLARLAVSLLQISDWSDAEAIGALRIGDFACGTGALLSAVYDQIALKHERAGGDPAALHRRMIEDVLYGCDVMPSAVHITSATLSGAQPDVGYNQSRIYTMQYGRQPDGAVKIGSLELLESSSEPVLFNTSDPALRTGSTGEEPAAQVIAEIPDEGFDLIIMNPPFTSNTKHRDAEDGVLNAAFAAFNATLDDQEAMADRLTALASGTAYHGHAGLGSAFAELAHRKLKPGGVIALVLLASVVNGSAWRNLRTLLAEEYDDLSVLSITDGDSDELSFSEDTGVAECLIVARKSESTQPTGGIKRGTFTSLRHRPPSFADAGAIASGVLRREEIRAIEAGPYGGTTIPIGDATFGEVLNAPVADSRLGWGAARLNDAAVAQVAHALSTGTLALPRSQQQHHVPIAHLGQVGRRGVDHQLLISDAHNGPFIKAPQSPTATFPALWSHSAERETRLVVAPDMELRVKSDMEERALDLWNGASYGDTKYAGASRAHISLDFRFTSQPLACAFTDDPCLGGTAWPNVTFADDALDYPFALWQNSTLALVLFWWRASRQQAGRGRTTLGPIVSLPILDLRQLSEAQIVTSQNIFNEFRDLELQPAYLADADPNRALLDRRVVCDLLGFDEEVYRGVRLLAEKWCAEPSVHSGKARPPGAKLVI